MTDNILLEFVNPNGADPNSQTPQSLTVSNGLLNGAGLTTFVSVNFEKDFFIPSDACTIVFESSYDLTNFLLTANIGWQVNISIVNGSIEKLQMIGYIFKYDLTYSRSSGTKLILEIKDLLSYMEQGTCPPNITSISTGQSQNLHFQPTDTLKYALQTIAGIFFNNTFNGQGTNIDINNLIQIDDSSNLTLASGFKTGLASKGKTPQSFIKSITSSLDHLATPNPGETYLSYMIRLAKHAGCNLKMIYQANGIPGQYIYVGPPVYDRDGTYIYELTHSSNANSSSDSDITNSINVLDAHYRFNLDDQPSVVIVEAATMGDGKFYQSTRKAIALNELTAFNGYGSTTSTDAFTVFSESTNRLSPLSSYINSLVSGTIGIGYTFSPYNNQLFIAFDKIKVHTSGSVSMPFYHKDNAAHTPAECQFAASMILAEKQDKFMEFTYRVQGWTNVDGIVWQPNTLVNIFDSAVTGGTNSFPMWIKRVNYLVSRSNGTICELTCTLPYTHNFEITP